MPGIRPAYEGLDMNKLAATLFLTALALGSMYGCVIDDGHGRSGHMEPQGEGPHDRDDHQDNHQDNHMDHDRHDDDRY